MALGLPTGMVAAHSGLPWKGRDPETWDWQKVKHSDDAVFNQLPLLFRPGKRTVAHSTAIVGVIARMAHEAKTSVGYDGSCNEDDECVSLMLIAEASDIYAALQKGQPTIYVEIGKGGKTETFHEELWGNEGRIALKRHLKCLEKLIAHGDDDAFTSEKTAGEMFLWGVMHQVVLLDGDVFAATPKLKAFYERVLKLPETQAMLDGTSPMGTMKQYFVAGPVR
jgi:glutathione S-transferase